MKVQEIPLFKPFTAEDKFWQEHDSSDYIDWSKAKQVQFENLKPSTKTISRS